MRMPRISCLRMVTALLLSLTITQVTRASSVVGPFYDPYSNAELYVVSQGSWTTAEAEAQALGGNLVTIHSAAENQFIVNTILQDFTGVGGPNLSDVPIWIGLYDPIGAAHDDGPGGPGSAHAANFQWVDGSTSTSRNWNTATGEPNDASPGEYYTAINWHQALGAGPVGTWNDTPLNGTTGYGGNTTGPYYGIAAVSVPEPATLVMLLRAVGIVGVSALYRRDRPE